MVLENQDIISRIIFMGTPEYADKILEKILQEKNFEVVGVFTQPDKPVGRKKVITPPPVKIRAEKNSIPVFQPQKLRDAVDKIRSLNPDFIVVGAYGQILTQDILDIAPSINLHTSILPKYRGASPIQQTLLNGDKETGVTAMKMDRGLDTGDILAVSRVQIDNSWKLEELYQKLTDMAGELIVDVLNRYSDLKPIPQNSSDASHCGKILKSDGEISFKLSSKNIIQKFKALTPWPSIYLQNGLKLLDISKSKDGSFLQGEILEVGKDFISVGCKNGSIQIKEVQPKSKSRMSVISYINGKRLKIGEQFI